MLYRLIATVLLLAAAHVASIIAGWLVPRFLGSIHGSEPTLSLLLSRLAQWAIWIVALLAVATLYGMGVQGALTAGGVVLVLGLSVQNYLTNMVDGSVLLSEHHYEVGDRVTLPTMGDVGGVVIDLRVRYTAFLLPDGRRQIVPNTTMFVNPLSVTPKEASCSTDTTRGPLLPSLPLWPWWVRWSVVARSFIPDRYRKLLRLRAPRHQVAPLSTSAPLAPDEPRPRSG